MSKRDHIQSYSSYQDIITMLDFVFCILWLIHAEPEQIALTRILQNLMYH